MFKGIPPTHALIVHPFFPPILSIIVRTLFCYFAVDRIEGNDPNNARPGVNRMRGEADWWVGRRVKKKFGDDG